MREDSPAASAPTGARSMMDDREVRGIEHEEKVSFGLNNNVQA